MFRPKNNGNLRDLLARMRALQGIVNQQDFETLMMGFKRAHRIIEKEAWSRTNVTPERFQHECEKTTFPCARQGSTRNH